MLAGCDARGYAISGASTRAQVAYEQALGELAAWRAGWHRPLAAALDDSPQFVMAHVLCAYACVGGRDRERAREAAAIHARAAACAANERERLHLAAVHALAVDDDPERARAAFTALLDRHPRDLLALHAAHALDYRVGALGQGADRAERVLGAWTDGLPGYGAVLAIRAFELEERGDYARAESLALRALDADPADARAMHAMAHVFEMTDRPAAGLAWLGAHAPRWAADTMVARHCWWHLALLHLQQGGAAHALALYDRRIAPSGEPEVADLIDAAALLWRLALDGHDAGDRWAALAARWAPRIADAYCSFSDVHAMLAFVGAGDWTLAATLERELARRQHDRTRHGETTRTIGLPACRAIMAYGRGCHAEAVGLLAGLPALAYRLGGSHAQRDILNLTLLRAVERMRRAARQPRLAA